MSSGDVHNFSARLPDDLYEALRHFAFDRRIPMNKALVELLRSRLAAEADNDSVAKDVREILGRLRQARSDGDS